MRQFLLLALISCVIAFSAPGFSFAGEEDPPSPSRILGAKTVSVEEAKSLYDNGTVFIDVRGDESYKAGTIPRSIHLDLDSKYTKRELLKYLRKYDEFVVFCDGIYCGRSVIAVKQAVRWGFKKIFYFRVGFPEWEKAGYPVKKVSGKINKKHH